MKRHESPLPLYDRIYGCLLGGACGDALGAPVEFLSYEQITSRYGPAGISEFDTAYGMLGAVTDDTQMALFTVEGLIRAAVRSATNGICSPPGIVHHAYQRWLETQDGSFEALSSRDDLDGWLIRDRRLWVRRAPGNTCLAALRSGEMDATIQNNSKGCGTVMRDAAFRFAGVFGAEHSFELAAETAGTTHGHPSARCSSGALAAIIALVVEGSSLREAVQNTLKLLSSRPDAYEVRVALERALDLSSKTDWRHRLPSLGEGWTAEEALSIAVLCALAAGDPREAVVASVNHDGDSDSTGAITGNLIGSYYGPSVFPASWVEKVELADVIEALARDYTNVLERRVDPALLWDRYPGW